MSVDTISVFEGSELDNRLLDGMFRLRYRVFFERLRWSVSTTEGKEVDEYDRPDVTYIIASNAAHEVFGCWRLIPTTRSYMLKDTFSGLLCGEQPPADPGIWELSRFAVNTAGEGSDHHKVISEITYQMVRCLYDFAQLKRITHYVTVTTTAVQRLMCRADIPLHRFGDGRSTKIGRAQSVACWVPVNEQFHQAVSLPVSSIVMGCSEPDLYSSLKQ